MAIVSNNSNEVLGVGDDRIVNRKYSLDGGLKFDGVSPYGYCQKVEELASWEGLTDEKKVKVAKIVKMVRSEMCAEN